MDKNRLKQDIKDRGLSVEEFCIKLSDNGCPLGESTFYKKLRGVSEFNALQIKKIGELLGYTEEDVMAVFFTELVS